MTINGRVAHATLMLAIFVGMDVVALGYPFKAALMPLVVGVPGAALCLFQLVTELRRAPAAEPQTQPVKRELQMIAWWGTFIAGILLFGFLIATPILLYAYLRFKLARAPLARTALCARRNRRRLRDFLAASFDPVVAGLLAADGERPADRALEKNDDLNISHPAPTLAPYGRRRTKPRRICRVRAADDIASTGRPQVRSPLFRDEQEHLRKFSLNCVERRLATLLG